MGMQQVVPPGFTLHLHQLPLHPEARPSPTTVSSPPGQPTVSQQNMAMQLQPAPRVPAANQQSTTPLLQPASRLFPGTGSSSTGQPAATQQNMAQQLQPAPRFLPVSVSSTTGQPAATAAPVLQIVHQSTALFSSTPNRPPQIHPITPLTVNLRVNNEIRAPAPHIQPFRSASTPGVKFTSLPHGMPSHSTPSRLQKTSHSLPLAPSCPREPSILTNHSGGLYDISLQSNTERGLSRLGLSTPINSSQSCITDIHKQHDAHRRNDFSPLLDLSSNLDSVDLSEFETGACMRVSSPHALR